MKREILEQQLSPFSFQHRLNDADSHLSRTMSVNEKEKICIALDSSFPTSSSTSKFKTAALLENKEGCKRRETVMLSIFQKVMTSIQ